MILIIESVDSISRDERGFSLTQYITNGGISRTGYTITHFNSFAVIRNYIACTCVGAHLLGITRVGDTAYCVWLIVFTGDCCVGSNAPMVVHVLDCRRGFEHLTGCKWRHARYIRCCLQRVIHALPISHGKGGLDSIT